MPAETVPSSTPARSIYEFKGIEITGKAAYIAKVAMEFPNDCKPCAIDRMRLLGSCAYDWMQRLGIEETGIEAARGLVFECVPSPCEHVVKGNADILERIAAIAPQPIVTLELPE